MPVLAGLYPELAGEPRLQPPRVPRIFAIGRAEVLNSSANFSKFFRRRQFRAFRPKLQRVSDFDPACFSWISCGCRPSLRGTGREPNGGSRWANCAGRLAYSESTSSTSRQVHASAHYVTRPRGNATFRRVPRTYVGPHRRCPLSPDNTRRDMMPPQLS